MFSKAYRGKNILEVDSKGEVFDTVVAIFWQQSAAVASNHLQGLQVQHPQVKKCLIRVN